MKKRGKPLILFPVSGCSIDQSLEAATTPVIFLCSSPMLSLGARQCHSLTIGGVVLRLPRALSLRGLLAQLRVRTLGE